MAVKMKLDHLVVCCTDLAEGVDYVQDALGVSLATGGVHEGMGTHNALLALGEVYLEVIAPDPAQPSPQCARMFDLDHYNGPPRLTNWVARVDNIAAGVALAPAEVGLATSLSRGDFQWQLTLPPDGKLPFDGAFPGLIQWPAGLHPVDRLPEAGCRLHSFEISHPDPGLRAALAVFDGDMASCVTQGPFGLSATIETPDGPRLLS